MLISGTGRPRVTIREVATDAGVSRSTVSLVLRNSPSIPHETRARVNASIRKLGYTYNRGAANLRSRSSQAIGLMINDIRNPFFAELTAGVERAASAAGLMLYLVDSSEDLQRQAQLLISLQEHGVAGLIICPATGSTEAMLRPIAESGIPVCIGVRPMQVAGADYAGPDHRRAAALAMEHLIAQGHREIAFIGGEVGNPARDERLAGYHAALRAIGVAARPELILTARPNHAAGLAGVEALLALPQPPTAALCFNDMVAIAALHALRRVGLAAGQDMAIAGLDGLGEAALASPPLTTVLLNAAQVGEEAMRLVLSRLAAPDRSPARVIVAPELVIRESSLGGPIASTAPRPSITRA